MARVYRSPLWPLVAVLLALYLAHDLGAAQALQPESPVLAATSIIRVKYIPDPKDIVNLAEGTPYVVPAGKLLIITDYTVTDPVIPSTAQATCHPRIRIDGVDAWGTGYYSMATPAGIATTSNASLTHTLATGIRASSGSFVTLHTNPDGSDPSWWVAMGGSPRMFASGYVAATQ